MKMLKGNRKKRSPKERREQALEKEIVHRPIFHYDTSTDSRVLHCTCRWVFQWHCRWGFPCQRRSGTRNINPIQPKSRPKKYGIKTEDKATETNLVTLSTDKASGTDLAVEKVNKSTQYDSANGILHPLPSPPIHKGKLVEISKRNESQRPIMKDVGTMTNTTEEHEQDEDKDEEKLTGEGLPKPFHSMKTIEKTLQKSVWKVPALLKRGVRVIKGPHYDHEKFTAVLGDYMGTVIRVEFQENKPELWKYTKDGISKYAVFPGKQSQENFEKNIDQIKGFEKEMIVTEDSFVEVQWDNGERELCAIGPEKFELLVYNTSEVHDNIICNGCGDEPIIGTRWKCVTCNIINLCTSCYMADKYNRNHVFQRIMIKDLEGPQMPSRSVSTNAGKRQRAYGVKKGSRVSFLEGNLQGSVLRPLKETIYRQKINNEVYPIQSVHSDLRVSVLQGIMLKEPVLPQLTPEMVRHLPEIRVMMKVDLKSDKTKSKYIAGAILAYRESGHSNQVEAKIQWDAEMNTEIYIVPSKTPLLLLDTGLKTEGRCTCCNKIIIGITLKNDSHGPYCNVCYMNNANDFTGKFTWECGDDFRGELKRENAPKKSKEVLMFLENDVNYKHIKVKKMCSSFCSSKEDSTIYRGKLAREQFLNPTIVQSTSGFVFLKDICDLKIQIGFEKYNDSHFYYEDHLHVLGEDETEYYEAQVQYFGTEKQKQVAKIQVHVWQTIWRKNSYRPVLHLIFVDENNEMFQDVLKILRYSRISCHLVQDNIILWHNSQENIHSCGVHQKTGKKTLINLLESGFGIFKVMKDDNMNKNVGRNESRSKKKKKSNNGILNINKTSCYVDYFINMAERFFGEKVMPVIITSKEIEKLTKCIKKKTHDEEIPILSFKDLDYVSVSWSSKSSMKNNTEKQGTNSKKSEEQASDYGFTICCPRKTSASVSPCSIVTRHATKNETEVNLIQSINSNENSKGQIVKNMFEVSLSQPWIVRELNVEITSKTTNDKQQSFICKDFGFLISSTLVGVVIHKLKCLHRRSETIPEGGMLFYVRCLSCHLLIEGRWVFPGEYISTLNNLNDIFAMKSIEFIYKKNMKDEIKSGLWEDFKVATKSAYRPPKEEGGQLILTKDCAGVDLVFFALLKKRKIAAGRQLIEKGCVGIRSILIGCKILNEYAEEWKASETEKKKFEDYAKEFSQHALNIMNYIQEKDELEGPNKPTGLVNSIKHSFTKKDDMPNKAGRLLLNHGYLDVAFKTKNECFLENPKLKTMIKELWYGKEDQTRKITNDIVRFFWSIMHVFIMPIMLITLDKPSWIYKKYHTPKLKLWVNMVGLVSFLIAFACMLLFDYKENCVSKLEYAVLFWIANKFLDEFEQMCVTVYRDRTRKTDEILWKKYWKDKWNLLDLWIIWTSFIGFFVKLFSEDDGLQTFAKIMYVLSFITLNIRLLNMFWTSEFLGSQLITIKKMIWITFAFMVIMIVIMMCYNVVDYALLYPNTEFTYTETLKIIRNGYWTIYGDFQEDVGDDCTDNSTLYSQGIQQRCPTSLGSYLSPYVRAIYCLIAILMLLNLLIAVYTKTSDTVHQKSLIYWSKLQSNFLEEYTIRTIFPVHFKICCLVALALHLLLHWIKKISGKQRGELARFIKVFVFDYTFDADPEQKTPEEMAEKNGMLEMQGERENRGLEDNGTEPPVEDVNEKINKIMEELNGVKRLWESREGQ